MLVENARRSCFPDSQNGAATDLCRNRGGAESRWPAQCVWPTLYESARRIYLPEGRFRGPETPLAARNSGSVVQYKVELGVLCVSGLLRASTGNEPKPRHRDLQ